VCGKTFSRRGRAVALLKKKIVCPFFTLSIGTFSSRTGDKIFENEVFSLSGESGSACTPLKELQPPGYAIFTSTGSGAVSHKIRW